MNPIIMRVFITGASGFLGGSLARALAQEGAEIRALCRPATDRALLQDLPIAWYQGDVISRESLVNLFRGADWIIHAAGRLGQAGVSEDTYLNVNVDGTRNVMAEALATEGRSRVLHLSSPGVLGPTGPHALGEDAPFVTTNPYERSKAAAERVVAEYAARGLPVVTARPGFVYGPGDRHVLGLFKSIERRRFFYIEGGRHLCQPTFVADAVGGMLACLRKGRVGEVYHLAGPQIVSFRELAETIASALSVPPPNLAMPRKLAMFLATALRALASVSGRTPALSPTAVAFFSEDRVVSWKKARDELGYLPRHDLPTGVAATAKWYREYGWL